MSRHKKPRHQRPMLDDRVPRRLSDDELGGRKLLESLGLEPVDGWDDEHLPDEPDYGGVLGADGQVYSDADPGL